MFRSRLMQPMFLSAALLLLATGTAAAQESQFNDIVAEPKGPLKKIPEGVILVKGAEPSASDDRTPLPEQNRIFSNVLQNRYLGLSWRLPADWWQEFEGPPPSDTGIYTLAQLIPTKSFKGPLKGTVLITAQDMFFTLLPASNPIERARYDKEHLPSYYDVERPPAEVKVGDRTFIRFDYKSEVAGLHWYVLATQVRCHLVQFVFTSQDTQMLESMIAGLGEMKLPAEERGGGDAPLCIADYAAKKENVLYRVEPVLADRKFNSVPVRIVIGKTGKVQHIHIISAFADQAVKIKEALLQWRFKPYKVNGEAVEVETGIVFGTPRPRIEGTAAKAATLE